MSGTGGGGGKGKSVVYASPVADIPALRAVLAADRQNYQGRLVTASGAVYVFNISGIGADDGDNVIVPSDVTPPVAGRWFKLLNSGLLDHNTLINLQGGSAAERYHLLSSELDKVNIWKSSGVLDHFGNPLTVIRPDNETASVFVGTPYSIDWEDTSFQPDGFTAHVVHTGSEFWAKRALIGVNTFNPSGRSDARAWGSQVLVYVPKTNMNAWGDPGYNDPTMVGGEWTVMYRGSSDLLYPGYIVGGYVVAHVWCNTDDSSDVTVDEIRGFNIQQPGVDPGYPPPGTPRRWLVNSKGLVIEDRVGEVAGHTANRWGLFVTTTAVNYLKNNLGIGTTTPLARVHARLIDNSADVTNPVLALFDCASGKKFNASSGKQTAFGVNPDFSGQSGTAEATILDLRSVAPSSQFGTRIGIDLSNSQLSNGTAGDNYWAKFNVDNFWRADGVIGAGASITLSGNYNYAFGYDIQNVSPGSSSFCSGQSIRNKSGGTFIAGWLNWNAWSGGDVLIAGSPYCTITGADNKILDDQSGGATVMGYANSVTNSPFVSVFGGANTLVDSMFSTVAGAMQNVTGMANFVTGFQHTVDGFICTAIGIQNNLNGTGLIAIGGKLTMTGLAGIALGFISPSVYMDRTRIDLEVTSDDCVTIQGGKKVGFSDFYGGEGDLDDLDPGGTYSGTTDKTYRIEIDAEGTPDTFKWSDTGGSVWNATGVPITGAAQTLNNGVTVTFTEDTTGHTLGDYWEFIAYAHTGDLAEWKSVSGSIGTVIQNDGSLKTKNRYEGKIVTDTTPYAPATTDQNIICNKATAMVVNLPAATASGRVLTIKNINVGVVTVNANGAETIDGVTPQTLNQWDSIIILDADTGVWVIL